MKFEMSMMEELTYFLGLQIKQDDKEISICQEHYTRNLLKKYEIYDSSSVKTTMVPPNNLGPDLAGKPVNETSYMGMIRFVSYALEVLLGPNYTQDESFRSSPTILSNYNFSKDPSKVTPIELTALMFVVNNREHSVTLLHFTTKKKKEKSQTVTLALPQSQDPEASGALPQKRKKPKFKKKPSGTKGTCKSQPLPEGIKSDPKDLVGNKQPIDKGFPFMVSNKGAAKTTSLPEGSRRDKDSEGLKPLADMERQTNPVDDLLRTGAKYQSDDEEVFVVGEDMDENTQADEEVQSPPLNTDKPESSLVQNTDDSTSDSSPKLKKYDNILPLTERQSVKYLRKDAVKEDPVLNKKVIEAIETYTKNSSHLTELLTLPESDKAKEEPTNVIPITTVKPTETLTPEVQPIAIIISTSQPEPSVPQRKGKGIATDEHIESPPMLVKATSDVRPDLDASILIKKAEEEVKRLVMTKIEVIKIVQKEAKKIGIDPKKVISAKAGEKFKKAQDAEIQVHKRQHTEKVKRL
nr:uncharacterized mitochondrial protein AtMg00810-like [Tanacetum cinerariifolium]